MSRPRLATLLAVAFPLLLAPPVCARAQTVPFGKNKIQYTHFDWQILSGEHLDVYYYPQEEELARVALEYGEETYRVLERRFRHHPFRRIPLVVYSSHQHFEQTNLTQGFIPEGVLGFTEFLKRRVALPFRGSYAQFRHTIRHELVHVFHLSKLAETYALHGQLRAGNLPYWWSEGLAEYWSSPQDSDDEMVVRDLVLEGRLPTLRQFTYSVNFLAYPLGGELFHYLGDRFGDEHIAEMYEEIWKYDSFEEAFRAVYGVPMEELDREWRYALEQRYFPLYQERRPTTLAAQRIHAGAGADFKPLVVEVEGDTVPSLFFLSPRTGYTNIYRTRLSGGEEPVRVVVQGERSAEFESLHPSESRMDAWDGRYLAFVSKFQERDALFVWDLEEGDVVGRYQWEDLVGLQSPAWSPDGTGIVFSGLSVTGPSDLYVLDFESGERRALTTDPYLDQDPDWSPDGRTIVFSSDRTPFGQDGSQNLFLVDAATGEVSHLTYGPWKDIDPRWSNDGSRVVFASDRSGINEVYVVSPDGTGRRVSDFTGAVFDPEWLPDDEGLVFTAYAESSLRMYRMDLPGPDTQDRIALHLPDGAPGPPAEAQGEQPDAGGGAVASAASGDPEPSHGGAGNGGAHATSPSGAEGETEADTTWTWVELEGGESDAESSEYSEWNSFSLDFAGGDALIAPGVASAQGIQLLGSDMLGNHILFASLTAVQAEDFQNLADAFSGQLLYLNLSRRINLGGGLFRFNGLFRDVSYNVYQEESYGGFFLASYPFSKYDRVELQIGLERSNRQDRPDFFRRDTREDPRDLTRNAVLARNFLSYVKDNTLWLPYGPIDGSRFNLSAGLVTDLSRARAESVILFGDYRRYLRTSLYTALALRGFAYYSGGAIPSRAALGGPHSLRGYPRLSLAGSRVWLVNTEWRFPLFHRATFNLPFGDLTLPGVQGATFADLGSSWLEEQTPEGSWGSYGLGFRVSMGYALVLRLDVGKRFKFGEPPPLLFDPDEDFGDTFVDFFFGFNF